MRLLEKRISRGFDRFLVEVYRPRNLRGLFLLVLCLAVVALGFHLLSRPLHDPFPIERRAGVRLVLLDVIVADEALIGFELFVREDSGDELSFVVTRVIAFDLGEDFAERGGEADEGLVLFVRQVVLVELGALDDAEHRFVAGGAANEILRMHAAIAEAFGDADARAAIGVLLIPRQQVFVRGRRVSAHVGDLDAYAAGVRGGGVPGTFFEVECLVDGAIDIHHEMHAEATGIVEDAEALAARAGDIEVIDELIHLVLQELQVPAAATHAFDLGIREAIFAETVAVGGFEGSDGDLRRFPRRLIEGRETTFHAIGVVTTRVHPSDDLGAGVEELAGNDDLIACAFERGARTLGERAASDDGQGAEQAKGAEEDGWKAWFVCHGKSLGDLRL
jgi:hypothetical protein